MEKKQQRLDEEELSWCSWQQEGLQMVLVDAAMGGKTAVNDSARTTQQQQQHTQTQVADEDGVSTERDRGFVDSDLKYRPRETGGLSMMSTERDRGFIDSSRGEFRWLEEEGDSW